MMKIEVNPTVPTKPYEYIVGEDIFLSLLSKASNEYYKILVVSDEVIDGLFLKDLNFEKLVIKTGEETKCFAVLEEIINGFSSRGLKRNSLVVAVGGGVIGDLVGFAASIYMRGIDYWQVPTTLVAMVDSSIGGKTGINTDFGKNLVGGFYHPKKIVADVKFLEKLPKSEVKNGLAEMYKHALIADMGLTEGLLDNPTDQKAVFDSAKVKIDIIEKDVFEKFERKFLNVGHTIAHAIEKESELSVSHGMAVAMGIKIESQMANKLGLLSDSDLAEIMSDLHKLEIDYDYKIKDLDQFIEYMLQDKKNSTDKIAFVFVCVPGEKIEVLELSEKEVRNFLVELC